MQAFNALIRTHHITSRKKIAVLRRAANACDCYVLLRTGSFPGMMYVEGPEDGVRQWIKAVQGLRYKDYNLAAKPAHIGWRLPAEIRKAGLNEVTKMEEFRDSMDNFHALNWWKRAMGYET